MLARPDEFRKVLTREVLSGKQAVMAGVVMLEAPVDAANLQVKGAAGLAVHVAIWLPHKGHVMICCQGPFRHLSPLAHGMQWQIVVVALHEGLARDLLHQRACTAV